MNKKAIILISIAMFLSLIYACTGTKTEVVVCGTLHGYHKKNTAYSYQNLYAFIEAYNPDVIGVEIRPEDIDTTVKFLRNYYPKEMVDVVEKFSDKNIYGIDWWNAEIEGAGMSEEIISTLPNIVWERQYLADTVFLNSKPQIIDELYDEKLEIVALSSIKQVVTGDYDSLNLAFYNELGNYFSDSPYERLYDSYMKRHEKIAQKMADIVSSNKGKRILFLTGIDHQVYGKRKLVEAFGSEINLNTPFQ